MRRMGVAEDETKGKDEKDVLDMEVRDEDEDEDETKGIDEKVVLAMEVREEELPR